MARVDLVFALVVGLLVSVNNCVEFEYEIISPLHVEYFLNSFNFLLQR